MPDEGFSQRPLRKRLLKVPRAPQEALQAALQQPLTVELMAPL